MTRMQVSTPDHPAIALLPAAPTGDQIEAFGRFLQSIEGKHEPVVDISTMHHHADGLYGRSVVIKAGTYLVGLPHLAGHLNVCVGDITVWTEGKRSRLTGAHILPSAPGATRIGFAHADTTWLSVHRNDTGSKVIANIEEALVATPEKLMSRRHKAPTNYLGPVVYGRAA